MTIEQKLAEFQHSFNQDLLRLTEQLDNKHSVPLKQAMQYSLTNGGKRLRPFLMYLVGEALEVDIKLLQPAAFALECIHSYSLVHDDLPAMDDDDLRRGKPTCHIQFDEATAILAGDALQALAFELIADAEVSSDVKVSWMKDLSHFAGYHGMCSGQALDLAAEDHKANLAELEQIHLHKTAALLRCAVRMACAAKPDLAPEYLTKIDLFASRLGLAFQIQDDVLDVISSTELLGKPQGSDEKLNKSTYPGLLGLAGAKDKTEQVYQSALEQIQDLPYNIELLSLLAQYIVKRQH
ncbi:(2E,6E)-farnesyl diphosphate synthase [Gayadomonas joobiniege]|uniref:(2E,6E)-farnesyl diphosphate synthase n=1 Tax=Gayadomonas joobiniege TaxID=1234606 RepID=UPI00036AF9E8|nr:farnesyl diphosphate synthase [Gayadomonas joobiniege]